jgi:hypothetical protein
MTLNRTQDLLTAVIKKYLAAFLTTTAIVAVIGFASVNGNNSAPTPSAKLEPAIHVLSYATPEKVQEVMTLYQSCTPTLEGIGHRSQLSGPGTYMYYVGCGRWGYAVLFWAPDRIEANRLPYEWNGRPMKEPGCKRLGGCDNLNGKHL